MQKNLPACCAVMGGVQFGKLKTPDSSLFYISGNTDTLNYLSLPVLPINVKSHSNSTYQIWQQILVPFSPSADGKTQRRFQHDSSTLLHCQPPEILSVSLATLMATLLQWTLGKTVDVL
jgi:hypothetical protein